MWLSSHVDSWKIALHFPWDLESFFVAIIKDSSALSPKLTAFLLEIFRVSSRIVNLKVMETSTGSEPTQISAILIHHIFLITVDNFNSEMCRLALYLFSRKQLFIILF